jgi:hypothetical protein
VCLEQLATKLRRRLQKTQSPLTDLFNHVLELPRGPDGYCSQLWKDLLLALASNHGCAGGLVKVPTLVQPVLDRIIRGELLNAVDGVILFQ